MSNLRVNLIEMADLLNEIHLYFNLVEIAVEELRDTGPSKTNDRLHLLLDLFMTRYRENHEACHDILFQTLQAVTGDSDLNSSALFHVELMSEPPN